MRSLYSKFIVFTFGLIILGFFGAFLVGNLFYHHLSKPSTDDKNFTVIQELTAYIESNDIDELEPFLEMYATSGYKLLLFDEEMNKQMFGPPFKRDTIDEAAVKAVLAGGEFHGMRDLPRKTFVTGFFADETVNTVGISFTFENETYALFLRPNIKMLFKEVHYLFTGMIFFMIFVTVIAVIYMARQIIKAVKKITDATKDIRHENFAITLPVNRRDEIGQLARNFQQMANKLEETNTMRKQFINDVSHDFQTPLQNIKGYIRLLEEEHVSQTDKEKYMRIIRNETDNLSALTKQLLVVTSLDAMKSTLEKEPVNIAKQIQQTIQNYRWSMMEKHISLTTNIEPLTIPASEQYIEKVWENLLSNAIKYTPNDGKISITVTQVADNAVITFTDTGVGMDEENIPFVFERFYRVDDARHASVEGTGLGLAIVKQVIDAHHGTITVDSQIGVGTTFTVHLPIGDVLQDEA